MWGKVSCLRKQHDERDWALDHQPSDLKSNALTTTPPHPLSEQQPHQYQPQYHHSRLES